MTDIIIYWFRRDLRLHDLPGLRAALTGGARVIPCYVHDSETLPGAAGCWWLHQSLAALADDIARRGSKLVLLEGKPAIALSKLAEETGADAVHCSRAYEDADIETERAVKAAGDSHGFTVRRYPGSLLFEPDQVANRSGLPFRVFTPFWRHCRSLPAPALPVGAPATLPAVNESHGVGLDALALLPEHDWARTWPERWQPGTEGASNAFSKFLGDRLSNYGNGRDYPDLNCTSRLSPHLHFGEISPRQVWQGIHQLLDEKPELQSQADKFLSELGWREFSHHLLFHFPHIYDEPFQPQFSKFPWLGESDQLAAWQQGRTGYPIVDAGMRELWHTGYMHNRVRMICASFLTKHLLLPWQLGRDWFEDTLVDADHANNACGWQWAAGSGADAAPYFRIFNPTLQSRKFDAEGRYLRRWVPELTNLPDKHIHQPECAPVEILKSAGIEPGVDYPLPVVDHREARTAALAAYSSVRK